MRTTLTLDDDIATRLKERSRQTGASFKHTVNELLRLGLEAVRATRPQPFKVVARPLGLREGIDLDNIGDLLEQIDGPAYK